VAQARALALNAQAAFRRQAMIGALGNAPDAVALSPLDVSRQHVTNGMVPPQMVPAIYTVYTPARADGLPANRITPAVGGDALRGETRR
jgi:hypothetical protein